MQSDGIKILATITALKLLYGKLYADELKRSDLSLDQIRAHHDQMVSAFSTGTLFVEGNPAVSERLSALVAQEIRDILRQVETALENSRLGWPQQ